MLVGSKVPISIVVPVGPYPRHREFLPAFIRSVEQQTVQPAEVVIVDDGGGCLEGTDRLVPPSVSTCRTRLVRNRWNLGIPASMNVGIGSTDYDLIIMACADDMLFPRCVELCWEAWEREKESLGYYYFGLQYSDSGDTQNCANGSAMVTKELWRRSGGFPSQSSVGAADHIFLHCMLLASRSGVLDVKQIKVSDEIIYWYRESSNGATSNNIWPAIEAVKEILGKKWMTQNDH